MSLNYTSVTLIVETMSLTVVGKVMENVKSLRKVLVLVKELFIIGGNRIIDLSSRRCISELLLKLPPHFFPSYRLVISTLVIERNRKVRKSKRPLLEYDSDSSGEEDGIHGSSRNEYSCCKYCHKLFYADVEEKYSPKANHDDLDINSTEVSSSVDALAIPRSIINAEEPMSTPPLRKITLEDLASVKLRASQGFNKMSKASPLFPSASFSRERPLNTSGNLMLTPPFRKITMEELKSVKLRPSQNFQRMPRTPDVQDMLNVLRRRYAALHSPMGSENDSFTSDEDSAGLGNHYEETSSYLFYNDYPSFVC